MDNRKAHIKRLILAVIVVFASLLQSSDGFMQKIWGVGILYSIPVVVCIAMFQGEIISMCCGLLAGVIWDSFSAQGHCFHTVFLVITGFVVSYIVQRRIRNTLISSLILNGGIIFIHNFLYWLIFISFRNISGAFYALMKYYIPSFFATVIISIFVYLIVRFVHKKMKEL